MPRFRSQPCGRRQSRLIRAATMPRSKGRDDARGFQPVQASAYRPLRQAGVADQGGHRRECAGAVARRGWLGHEHDLARARRLAAAIGGDRGEVERQRDRLDAHRAPLGGCAAPATRAPAGGLSFGLTHPVRSCSPADANRLPAQVWYARDRWWMAQRSPRKRVRGQPLRGFKSHLHRRWPARTPVLTAGRRARRGPLVSFGGLSYEPHAVPSPGSAAAVVPGHGHRGRR